MLKGTGGCGWGEDLLTLSPLSSVYVEPDTVRQLFNDTDGDQLWLIVGSPHESANTLELTPEVMSDIYPDGPQALPPRARA